MEPPTVTKCIRTDEHLIEQFLTGAREESEEAFSAVMKRHGPMVMGLCRQMLGRYQDAEDVFQATFMALARKASAIRDRRVLASWLYEVAYRIAIRRRATVARGPALSEMADRETPGDEPGKAAARKELGRLVRAEVERLPAKYRMLVVQCYLKGETNRELASRLDCPVGTIKGGLSRARAMLRRRLCCTELDPRGFGNCAC
jgi:RNA polymerase sigma factor (sigma-70 family)